MAQKLVVDCSTGEQVYVDLTPEEEAEILVRQAAAVQEDIDQQLAQAGIRVEG